MKRICGDRLFGNITSLLSQMGCVALLFVELLFLCSNVKGDSVVMMFSCSGSSQMNYLNIALVTILVVDLLTS